MLTHEENELLTRVGPGTEMNELFRRFWLPALLAEEMPAPDSPPVRVTLLGEELVAFKDTAGRIGFLDKRCPHRLANLFWGRNEEGGLRCIYHGWKYDVEGNCLDIPNVAKGDSFRENIKTFAAYPGIERGGIVWVYMGPKELNPEPPELEWTRVPDDHRYVRKMVLPSNYLQSMEGDIDSSHVSFLHRLPDYGPAADTLTGIGNPLMFKDRTPHWTIKDTDYGVMLAARRAGRDEGSYYWRVNQWLMPSYTIIAGKRDAALHCNIRVPIDDEHTIYFRLWWHADRPLSEAELDDLKHAGIMMPELIPGTFVPVENKTNDYLIDRETQRTRSFTGIKSVPAQDFAVQDDQAGPRMDRRLEHLVSSDQAIIQVRRRLLRALRELREGQEPPEAHDGARYSVRSLDMELPKGVAIEDGGREYMTAKV